MLRTFGDVSKEKSQSFRIEDAEHLNKTLADESLYANGKFKLMELMLPMFDVPDKLKQFTS